MQMTADNIKAEVWGEDGLQGAWATSRDGESTASPEGVSWLRRGFAQLRIKLTLPYIVLALFVAAIGAVLIGQVVRELLEGLFRDALVETGQAAADNVVRIEQEQLRIWRLVAYTEGFAEAVAEGDGDAAGELASPLAINERLDCLEVLDEDANALLVMHHEPDGGLTDYAFTPGTDYGDWEVVRKVLASEVDEAGDKYADLIETDWGWVFYTAGPVKREGKVIGTLLVGTYLDVVVEELDRTTVAHISVYRDGMVLATTLTSQGQEKLALSDSDYRAVLANQDDRAPQRQVEVAEGEFAELFGAFEARHGRDLGVLSVALPLSSVAEIGYLTRGQLLTVFGGTIVLTLVVGALLASGVVRRVRQLAIATEQVAGGDLTTQVESRGYDEVASLAGDFNRMVVQLREGRTYRDLLGLTASPEVAEQLRRGVEGGRVRLDPQSANVTVLFCDIRGFTRLSETREPPYVIDLLNEYMQGIVKIIRAHNGVINKFVGDAALAFFGLLPEARPPEQSAREAISTAQAMLEYLAELNRQRRGRSEEPLRVGIGINTGPVVAGMVGSEMRLEYTVLGDAVNVAQRLSDLNKEYPQCDIFFSAQTYHELEEAFQGRAIHIGKSRVKGRVAPVDVYALVRGRE